MIRAPSGPSGADAPSLAGAPADLVGIEFGEDRGDGAALRLEIGPRHLDHEGAVASGVRFTLADTALACDITRALRAHCTTAEAKISCLAPATAGVLTARSRIVRAGRAIVAAAVSVHCGEEHVAEALFTFVVLGRPRPAAPGAGSRPI